MPHSFGYRARTRHLFARKFREHGTLKTQIMLQTYKVGEIVDIAANGSVHKGMPHKFYHGKTGRVWNVTKQAIGVEVNKRVGNRIIPKRIHVRIEHVQHSKCRQEFLDRVKQNEAAKAQAKKDGVRVNTKRLPVQPKEQQFLKAKHTQVESLNALPFVVLA